MNHFGILGLIPFVIGIGVLLWQRDIILSIIGCLILGSIFLARFNPFIGFFRTAGEIVTGALINSSSIATLIIIIESFILFALLTRGGFITSFTRGISTRKFERSIFEIIVLSSSVLIFINRYIASLLVGLFTRPFAEKKKLSPVRHSYIINTVSSSVATLIPLTTLTPLTIGAIGTSFQSLGIQFSPIKAIVLSLPYQFFTIFALFNVVAIILLKKEIPLVKYIDFLKKDRILSVNFTSETGLKSDFRKATYGIGTSLGVVFGSIAAGLIFMKNAAGVFSAGSLQPMQIVFINALFTGIVFTIIYLILTRVIDYAHFKLEPDGFYSKLFSIFIYIILSMSAGVLARKLEIHTGLFKGLTGHPVSIQAVPLVVFVLSTIVSFASGSAPLTIVSVIPIALRITSSNMSDPLLMNSWVFATIGAVLSGAAFGDINSPLSVNFILSTVSTNAPLTGHFLSQLIPSFIAYLSSILFGYLLLMINVKPFLSIATGFLAISISMYFFVPDRE
ncbi:MAG: Na+/H+ antiporter NhaC family protein [Spirochaetota bacterium]